MVPKAARFAWASLVLFAGLTPAATAHADEGRRKSAYLALSMLGVDSRLLNKPMTLTGAGERARPIKGFREVDACTTEVKFPSGDPVLVGWRDVTEVVLDGQKVVLVGADATFTAVLPDQSAKLTRVLAGLDEECDAAG